MGIAERKEREKADMRRRIVDAAIKMFVEEGYEKISIRNIAEKIEYSPATIYLYYKDKDELLHDMQGEAFIALGVMFEQKLTARDPLKRLEQLMQLYLQFAFDQPELYDLMFIIKAPMNTLKESEDWMNGLACYRFLEEIMEECVTQKLIRMHDVRLATLSAWAHAHGFVSLYLRCRLKISGFDEADIPKVIEKALKDYLKLLRA
ncbi:MAG TPA: TetR/AcrR family transcriptional regulator [Chitinophaga sp.]|uniref:TetR/AcrR family transcriptional regulator n=1 Tax=Chitinophaga sp. TaxID=1869181 RepID=UPI002C4B60B5|nr:TetR/AcrR family transcriptional regulator [Chitinophaga sp.]HVI48392.1 TetR/AcrR family transcriptional regulator [Chitinophaga sp.]